MAKKRQKIILYLSAYNENSKLAAYDCPVGGAVEGVQTNEAPVKYLLREHKDISEIICLVTTKAEETAWGLFQKVVQKFVQEEDEQKANREVQCRPIFIPDEKDFARDILPEVIEAAQTADEIFLETTGGLRDAVMYLLLISRALSYAGVKTAGAVYSNYATRSITDAMPIIRLFDLIGGMQEATSFGNVRTLREYYGSPAQNDSVEKLLTAMENLWETIALCRTERLTGCLDEFNAAMERAQNSADPLMRALLPAFGKKYGKKMSIPGVIKWCVDSDMLQQALTIYRERIPGYILNERSKDILELKSNNLLDKVKESKEEYQDEYDKCFEIFCREFRKAKKGGRTKGEAFRVGEFQVGDFLMHCTISQMNQIVKDYRRIRDLRNHVNHANGGEEENGDLSEKTKKGCGSKTAGDTNANDVRDAIRSALKNLRLGR